MDNVEKVEFEFESGIHIVWIKERKGWQVIKYLHGVIGKHIYTLMLPTIINAKHFATKLN